MARRGALRLLPLLRRSYSRQAKALTLDTWCDSQSCRRKGSLRASPCSPGLRYCPTRALASPPTQCGLLTTTHSTVGTARRRPCRSGRRTSTSGETRPSLSPQQAPRPPPLSQARVGSWKSCGRLRRERKAGRDWRVIFLAANWKRRLLLLPRNEVVFLLASLRRESSTNSIGELNSPRQLTSPHRPLSSSHLSLRPPHSMLNPLGSTRGRHTAEEEDIACPSRPLCPSHDPAPPSSRPEGADTRPAYMQTGCR